ncbi:bifunctional ADP-dependent NAD(P)H-hydrate dehydratase/NAD(P)H-hydrate epimerase [Ruegeria pomeroyi]|nr:bifunctional ADP-dependent NAD(P)H-hydrate dehydratase/NAD(P)H-hydrate epimerase [Ruegeria pomeroyi]NVK97162.1 bifunctional ADP-dependent NAD(P)H-hydrate dehydratase/NAD(P)H-hydrate epimerase [Ruegeria pomeroyi]NVL00482.1 bifunctional ADP-dependent NAD(P)H-hydrate dehydratase/NAD(P)H-hydrate epimerase [Ruegeria pomeroyi]QWV09137.1 bifunctional ADP-dependent NAD(P)H-hydrate dehydratase/NAD(P)H-hydrate epimerase [Ruegeria pomeroyi]HCE70911.1 bifunctional ADP-dependent NAD(P)H-hydrate dehydrata
MSELLTAAQMRAIEQAAIASGEVTGLELMERAGRGVVEAIFEEWPELGEAGGPTPQTPWSTSGEMKKAVVLCGPGNNGGDGFVVARLLHERGWAVEVFLYGDPEKLPPDARVNYERWCQAGEVQAFAKFEPENWNWQTGEVGAVDLIVDAVFGTGLVRPVGSEMWLHEKIGVLTTEVVNARRVAIDLPSGLCADSGKPLIDTQDETGRGKLKFELSVSFHREKVGHRISDGPAFCGRTVVKSIGLDDLPSSRAVARELASEIVRLAQPRLSDKAAESHKYTHGHALILSGGSGKTGAARLAARGALRIGAGLVTLGVSPGAQQEVACQITALMLTRIEGADGFAAVLEDTRLNALCLGPGMGVERARDLVPVALNAKRATVLDADALTAYAGDPAELFALLHEACVLTPHGGEFARLFPDIAKRLRKEPKSGPAYSKVDATREAAKRAGCVVLFKGPDTVIAAPDGRCSVNSAHYLRSAPWLATAGSGDVLAGFVTGLLARGFAPMQAAETAAWLHVECALEFGPGLIAEDLPEQLPAVFRKLGV